MAGGSPEDGAGASSPEKSLRNLVFSALGLLGGALVIRKLTKNTKLWDDHTRKVADSLSGEKVSLDILISTTRI